jgi:hypothetical protein
MCGVEPGDGGKENGKDVQGSASGSWSTYVVRVLAVPPSDVLALRWLRAAANSGHGSHRWRSNCRRAASSRVHSSAGPVDTSGLKLNVSSWYCDHFHSSPRVAGAVSKLGSCERLKHMQ